VFNPSKARVVMRSARSPRNIRFANGGTRPDAPIPPPKIRIAAPLPFEDMPNPLAVVAIANLDPTGRLLRQVRALLPFGDDAF
jgi:hypothetical protein